MARALSASMDAAMAGETRKPTFKVEIFDIRSTSTEDTPTRINDVVLFNLGLGGTFPAIVGPRDFTNDVIEVTVTEVAGDYVQNGVAATTIQFAVSDPAGDFDPVDNPAPASGRWLRQGNVVVVREGDLDVIEAEWPIVFTGALQGQPGEDRNRTTGSAVLTAKAKSREVDFLRRLNTTRNFVQNVTFQSIVEEIATTDMGLSADEVSLPTFSSRLTRFASNQFAEESPLVSIAKLMFVDGFMPRFAGDGQLKATDGSITKAAARLYPERSLQLAVTRPITEQNGVNEVEVIGLDPDKDQVIQGRQELARASITTGFFSRKATIDVFWSDDRTQQALDVNFEVDASIADGIFNFGGESFTNNPSAVDGGSVDGTIEVDGGLEQSLVFAGILAGAYISSFSIPDNVLVIGVGASTGITVPIGSLLQGALGQSLMTILSMAGRGQYRVTGRPYEYVFKEIRCVARIQGIRSEDRQDLSIENHLINSQADCDTVAERILRRERAKQNVRNIRMLHDVALEPDDIIELGSGVAARRYAIQSMKRTLRRGTSPIDTITAFEVTAGVRP